MVRGTERARACARRERDPGCTKKEFQQNQGI
jgi:hypothetical protein